MIALHKAGTSLKYGIGLRI